MQAFSSTKDKIFFTKKENFEQTALELFHYQATYNPVYRSFINCLNINSSNITKIVQIPFLPVELFKQHVIKTGNFKAEKVFKSSGTAYQQRSFHYVKDVSLYQESYMKAFEMFFGPVKNQAILALLPSYLEQGEASLVNMVEGLVQSSSYPESGFFLYDHDLLLKTIYNLKRKNANIVLFGVIYALLDLAENYEPDLQDVAIIETGGMKGLRREMVREELHGTLKEKFNKNSIQTEYGMTEMLSQVYALKDGVFKSPPWMKVLVRDPYDPFDISEKGRGAINMVDLANVHSCCFLATQDLGHIHEDESFEVLGRFDNSDIRGCNLMVG